MVRRTRGIDDSGSQQDSNGKSVEPRKRRQRQHTKSNSEELQKKHTVTSGSQQDSNGKSASIANNNPLKKTLVINQHTADIIVPRSYPRQEGEIHGKSLESLRFLSGTVTPVDAEIWASVKRRNRMVCRYLEKGLLAETESKKETGALIQSTVSLSPPEHLLSVQEDKTRIERENVSQVEL